MATLHNRLQLSMLNRKKGKKHAEKGFTLIELLITVVILGVLSAVALPGFLSQRDKADIAAANAQGKALMTACKTAILDGTTVPANLINASPGKKFGKITWTSTVTQTSGVPTVCSSATTSTVTNSTDQSYILDVSTGNMTTEVDAG